MSETLLQDHFLEDILGVFQSFFGHKCIFRAFKSEP